MGEIKTHLFETEFEREIVWVESVNTNVTVLSAGGVAFTVWVIDNRLNRTEVTLHASKLFLEDKVEEASLEFTSFGCLQRSLHSFLTTTKNDVFQQRRDGCRVDRSLSWEDFQFFKCFQIEELYIDENARNAELVLNDEEEIES